MITDSIFSQSRFELEGNHLYFIDDERRQQLESSIPVVIYGSRGTGKTTLLYSLNYSEQLHNTKLADKIGKKYKEEYLGVYIKLSDLMIDVFSEWNYDNVSQQLFSLYIDLSWLEALFTALSELSVFNELKITASDERTICAKAIACNLAFVQAANINKQNFGFADLANLFKTTRESLQAEAQYKTETIEIHKRLSISGTAGSYGRQISAILSQYFVKNGMASYKIKVCMDECECLNPFQIKILSTMLRLSKHPAFFVCSFISLPDNFNQTLINNLTLARADVQLIPLDEMDDKEFEKFAEGVVNVRLTGKGIKLESGFRNEKIFGKLSINSLIKTRFHNKSENKDVMNFLTSAEKNATKKFFEYYKNEGIPYYQYYLTEKLKIDIENYQDPTWRKGRRQQESKEIRKKMVAAYLSICNDFNTDPLYACSEMIFQLCDKSIRDYLYQLHEIFIEFNKPLKEFIKSKIPISIQDKAIKRASDNKIKSLPKAPLESTHEVSRVVYGLAHLTSMIQSSSADGSHLKSSERGKFVLEKFNDRMYKKSINFVINAAEAGFLKIMSNDQNKIVFRVHTSLAPKFHFSYRGAYYETQLTIKTIQEIVGSNNEEELMIKIRQIANSKFNYENNQMHFEGI